MTNKKDDKARPNCEGRRKTIRESELPQDPRNDCIRNIKDQWAPEIMNNIFTNITPLSPTNKSIKSKSQPCVQSPPSSQSWHWPASPSQHPLATRPSPSETITHPQSVSFKHPSRLCNDGTDTTYYRLRRRSRDPPRTSQPQCRCPRQPAGNGTTHVRKTPHRRSGLRNEVEGWARDVLGKDDPEPVFQRCVDGRHWPWAGR
jgi:hypothetical protein